VDEPDCESLPVKLRIVQYLLDGQPYTAFAALDDNQWSDVIEVGSGDLSAYRKHVIDVVPGHAPSEEIKVAARRMFLRLYGSKYMADWGAQSNRPGT
jgi:hypothetical protein